MSNYSLFIDRRHIASFTLMLILFFSYTSSTAQNNESQSVSNLIYNPSFEDYLECPRRIDATGQLTIVEGWYQPTAGSADYFNACANGACGVPRNKMGYQPAHSGKGYCGIYVSKTDYREYLQTELKEPLQAGCTYKLSYYVSLSEYSPCAIATMGALLTTHRATDTTRHILTLNEVRDLGGGMRQTISTYHTPQVQNNFNSPLTDYRRWQKIEGTFTASGGERFLTLGNFATAAKSNVVIPDSVTGELSGAYYFIDDVELVLQKCPPTPIPQSVSVKPTNDEPTNDPSIEPTATYRKGQTIVLKNIFFEFDQSVLLQQSYNELQRLLQLMQKHPSMRIMILGHTDNQGKAAYNQRLSDQRAKAVVDYLIRKGIDPKRLQSRGYGASKPIAPNTTPEGRAENRRVEMQIIAQ